MNEKEKQQCVICHKDITKELPKIDIYGNHYCKDCYIEKCKYDVMNMGDTILINKELLKRELQYLEEQTRKYTRKETAREIIDKVNGMSGGQMIAQALREMYLDEESTAINENLKEFLL